MYVDPRYIPSFQDWSDFMYPTLQQYGAIEQFTHGSDWKSWAAGLLSLNGIAQKGAPSPYQFDDWRDWAYRLIDTLGSGE
jgi:hypothetical protein